MDSKCRICQTKSSLIEKISGTVYCSVPCQFIGNDIMKLPNETIEQIVMGMDGSAIVKLAKINAEFAQWLFMHHPKFYFEKLSVYDIRYFQKVNKAFNDWFVKKFIRDPANMISRSSGPFFYIFKNGNGDTLELQRDENQTDEEDDYMYPTIFRILLSTNDQSVIMELKKYKIYGTVWNYPTDTEYKYHILLEMDANIEIMLQVLWDTFGFRVEN